MPVCLILALLWGLAAGGMSAVPPRFHGPMVWGLIGTGIPLLGLMTLQAGPVFGLTGLVAAVLLLSRAIGRAHPGEV